MQHISNIVRRVRSESTCPERFCHLFLARPPRSPAIGAGLAALVRLACGGVQVDTDDEHQYADEEHHQHQDVLQLVVLVQLLHQLALLRFQRLHLRLYRIIRAGHRALLLNLHTKLARKTVITTTIRLSYIPSTFDCNSAALYDH